MLQISADVTTLTTEQREAFAAFILNFPQPASKNIEFLPQHNDEERVIIPAFTVNVEEDETPSPEQAFATSGPVLVPAPPSPLAAAPTAVAPVTTQSSDGSVSTAGSLDKDGIPWDERIHSSSRVKNADGSWRRKRGIDDAKAAPVESELKALMGIPAAATVPAPPVASTPIATVVADRQAFVALLVKATGAIGAKKITQDDVNNAVIALGVPSLSLLANRLDLVPQVSATLDALMQG